MSPFIKILRNQVGSFILYSIAVFTITAIIKGAASVVLIFYALAMFVQVLSNIAHSIQGFVKKNSDAGAAYLLSAVIIGCLSVPACIGGISLGSGR